MRPLCMSRYLCTILWDILSWYWWRCNQFRRWASSYGSFAINKMSWTNRGAGGLKRFSSDLFSLSFCLGDKLLPPISLLHLAVNLLLQSCIYTPTLIVYRFTWYMWARPTTRSAHFLHFLLLWCDFDILIISGEAITTRFNCNPIYEQPTMHISTRAEERGKGEGMS